jgi:phosphate-selective porin OprO/OprP
MTRTRLFVLCGSLLAAALPCAAQATDFDNWPVSYDVGGGNTFAFTGNFAYDYNGFSGDDRLEDKDFMRRKEFGATLKKAGVYDAMVYFDFQSHLWLDVYVRVETKALFGHDIGKIRVGYIKTPVGMDALTSSRSVSMQELSLPNQAFYAGRRTGVE